MELFEENIINISFVKNNGFNEVKVFKEVVTMLNKELNRASLTKMRFTNDQTQLIRNLNNMLEEHESYTDKTDN